MGSARILLPASHENHPRHSSRPCRCSSAPRDAHTGILPDKLPAQGRRTCQGLADAATCDCYDGVGGTEKRRDEEIWNLARAGGGREGRVCRCARRKQGNVNGEHTRCFGH